MVTTWRRSWRGALVAEGGDPDPRAGKKGEMLREDSVLMRAHADTRSAYSIVEDGDPDPRAGKKGEMLCGDWVPMRVLRSAWPG